MVVIVYNVGRQVSWSTFRSRSRAPRLAQFLHVLHITICDLQVVEMAQWNAEQFFQIAVVNVALNQAWTAVLIFLVLFLHESAFNLSTVLTGIAGFTSGFLIPLNDIPWL